MKRLHVHLHVDEITESIGPYSQLFSVEPARREGGCGQAVWGRGQVVIRQLQGAQ